MKKSDRKKLEQAEVILAKEKKRRGSRLTNAVTVLTLLAVVGLAIAALATLESETAADMESAE